MKAKIYGRVIEANTLQGIKMKASKIANQYCNVIDEMFVTMTLHTFKYTRINKKYPNNTITFGEWR